MASGVVRRSALAGVRGRAVCTRPGGKGQCVGEGRCVPGAGALGSEEGADSGWGVRRLPQGYGRAEGGVCSQWSTAQRYGREGP